ncbi:MAG: GreA/GreB family elongation factor [Myxococcales bacterium]|nr:GreA/GreB family elongation factor [Myxococcales bacterium]
MPSPQTIDKAAVLEQLRARVKAELERAMGSQKDVQAGATHEEARPENDKDTRAIEATYLARGLAERVATLEHAHLALSKLVLRDFGESDPIALGALVTLQEPESGAVRHYFLAPAAGGERLGTAGQSVLIVTTAAPLGRALLGCHLGDEVRVPAPRGARDMEIVALS